MTAGLTKKVRRPGEHKTSAAVRARIIEAAFEMVSTHGYSGTTMVKVARRAALPIGSVYWHFENKDLLLASMIETSFERWHEEIVGNNCPLPGETFEAHVMRIFGNPAIPKFVAADFWRLGVILSVEHAAREQTARARFMKIRELQKKELATWWQQILPSDLLAHAPDLPQRLSVLTLVMHDGNAIAGASSDEPLEDFHVVLASALIQMVARVRSDLAAGSATQRRMRATPTRSDGQPITDPA